MNDPAKIASAALDRAKAIARGCSGLAALLPSKITPQAISQWGRVPASRVLEVETATGISRSELRPDLYPPQPSPEPAQ